ncbi:hypothetical protein AALP_AA7G209000 [Arabis alpina]|uniref:F-box domain-containing protein n=1 Tax=Arabis alpina TaxID=50452 RepID=A0A087GJI2_ARAAL|nr:hypothetical protein AALP_AA7G209000 [Arabis alpina]
MRTRRQRISEDRQSISRIVNGGGSSVLLPIDLIIEILSRLPAKSIARCRCVSKLWGSIIRSQVFTELVLTRSATTQPHLLFACEKNGEVFFYSSPQNPYEKSSPITANYHMKFPFDDDDFVLRPVHGLICLKQIRIFKGRNTTALMICNPSTGQSLTLPRVKTRRVDVMSFLGYDPVGKQFKLLSMTSSISGSNRVSAEHQILTLGNGKLSWRKIECSTPHYPLSRGICINGVLYYPAEDKCIEGKFRIACFDIRSEKFKLIKRVDEVVRGKLVNYKGKLATLRTDTSPFSICRRSRSFELCVLEDAEKHEWSTHTYVLPPLSTDLVSSSGMFFQGVTRRGEIVLSPPSYYPSDPFYLLYYNLERNTFVKVEIQGIHMHVRHKVYTFVDHVENVKLGGVFETS